jgi:Basic region leucine zipper
VELIEVVISHHEEKSFLQRRKYGQDSVAHGLPMFHDTDLDLAISDPWFPLFPDSNVVEPSPIKQSPLQPNKELEVSEHLRNNQHRRSGSSPGSMKASSTAGVSARKRNQPLPPILVEDPTDTATIKRARNTLAARKSRQKKMERFEELESSIAKLEEERDHWKLKSFSRAAPPKSSGHIDDDLRPATPHLRGIPPAVVIVVR